VTRLGAPVAHLHRRVVGPVAGILMEAVFQVAAGGIEEVFQCAALRLWCLAVELGQDGGDAGKKC